MMQLMSVPQTTVIYADTVNQQFHKSKSHYVSLRQRLDDNIQSDAYKQQVLADAILNFKTNFPNIKSWIDLQLCKGESTTLDKIEIDITLQRMLDIMHSINIVDHFKQLFVMPIQVYEEPARPGKFICWDGQHTAIVLYIIAKYILNEDVSKCIIPINIYASNQKAEMRECFITLNGPEGKKSLDEIDKFHQKVFGVRTDGNTRADWVLNADKQSALENAKMFVTHTKFGDTDQPGALTRMQELIDPRYDLTITQNFCQYFVSVCRSGRPVQPKECWLMYEFFRLCKESNITVDAAYISGVANSIKKSFDTGDMDSLALCAQAKYSYQEWFRLNKPNPDGTLWGISYPKETVLGVTFLIAQIAKHFKGQLPRLQNLYWNVPAKDLF